MEPKRPNTSCHTRRGIQFGLSSFPLTWGPFSGLLVWRCVEPSNHTRDIKLLGTQASIQSHSWSWNKSGPLICDTTAYTSWQALPSLLPTSHNSLLQRQPNMSLILSNGILNFIHQMTNKWRIRVWKIIILWLIHHVLQQHRDWRTA